jgi:hypothetical protein
VTLCEDCEHRHPESDKRHPAKWMCMKFPRLEGHGFMCSGKWVGFDPWMYCIGINGGACPLFERKRGPQMEMETR